MRFKIKSNHTPSGDQPQAIKQLVDGFDKFPTRGGSASGGKKQTLLGVTGSGKTFTVANVIQEVNKPTLVLAHNKTLAAQLYEEFKELFPENKVCYFISFYDYYQPESYMPATDTYIEKDMSINERIEEYRMEAIASVLTRPDTIIVSSVSCIYTLGDPEEYKSEIMEIKVGQKIKRDDFLRDLVRMLYERNDLELMSGRFRVKGSTIDLIQGFGHIVFRIEFEGDIISSIRRVEPQNNKIIGEETNLMIYPPTPYITSHDKIERAEVTIRKEMEERIKVLPDLEAHRLKTRTLHDLEMIKEIGHCKGIENYSRHFDGRQPGQPAKTLLDFFPKDFLMVIDESHQSIPQVHGMFNGDKARKQNLIDYGFRLPSALDNRPLKFEEFEKFLNNVIFVSATPAQYELDESKQVVEQLIRPTGLIDPHVEVRKTEGQIDNLLREIEKTINRKNDKSINRGRVIITTLTKKMAEDLTEYLIGKDIKARYLHSEIDTLERTEILHNFRRGEFDVIVGINLLREGLDLPEVSLVAIMDADKEGFLRNETSLIQTIGRAARNVDGHVIMYADEMTGSMKRAIKETDRRRAKQVAYNEKNGITPESIRKALSAKAPTIKLENEKTKKRFKAKNLGELITEVEIQMSEAADNLDFEKAIELRDELKRIKAEAGLLE